MTSSLRAGLVETIERLDAARAAGIVYTYGQIQFELNSLLERHPETVAPVSEFTLRYTSWDTDPYYYRDWSGAKKIVVNADTEAEAISKARKVLGEPPSGRRWAFQTAAIRELGMS